MGFNENKIEQETFTKIFSLIKESRAKIYDELEKTEIIKRVNPNHQKLNMKKS